MLQDLQKTKKYGETLTFFLTLFHQFRPIDGRLRKIGVRTYADVAFFINVIVTITLLGNVISAQHLAVITNIHDNPLHCIQKDRV